MFTAAMLEELNNKIYFAKNIYISQIEETILLFCSSNMAAGTHSIIVFS